MCIHDVSIGAVVHFILHSINIWFCCSVFNVLVAILTFSTDNIMKRHPRAVFLLEFILATVISGIIVIAVYKNGSYKHDDRLMYMCVALTDYDQVFYSYTLPFQIYCIAAVTMCTMIVQRIKQVSTRKESV